MKSLTEVDVYHEWDEIVKTEAQKLLPFQSWNAQQ